MDKLEFGKAAVHVSKDAKAMADEAAHEFARLAIDAVKARGIFTVALSGGSSPPMVYERLLQDDLRDTVPWDKMHYFIGDERCVPESSPENNFSVARKDLLNKVNAPSANLHPIVNPDKDPAAAALHYEEELRKFFKLKAGEYPQFDLIWLGMGPDGHCASLFPGTKALTEVNRLVVENFVEKLSAYRITFTFPVINHAHNIMFVVHGEDKAQVLAEALTSDVKKYPVQHVVPEHGKLDWYVDTSTAKLLCAIPRS